MRVFSKFNKLAKLSARESFWLKVHYILRLCKVLRLKKFSFVIFLLQKKFDIYRKTFYPICISDQILLLANKNKRSTWYMFCFDVISIRYHETKDPPDTCFGLIQSQYDILKTLPKTYQKSANSDDSYLLKIVTNCHKELHLRYWQGFESVSNR